MKRTFNLLFVCTGFLFLQCERSNQTVVTSGAEPFYVIPDGVHTRWASAENPKGEKGVGAQSNAGRKGSPCIVDFKNGTQQVLAEVTGASGMVRRIWVTINDRSPQMLRGLKLDMYWDGATEPAVSSPIGDFFSQGLGRMTAFQSALFSNPEGRSFNCAIPMPFKTGMKVVATNESGKDLELFFYDVDYTLGDILPEDMLYFHAYYRRENPTEMREDYTILPGVEGKGRYLGCNIGVIPNTDLYFRSWWGEGEVKVYLDGDADYPTIAGTGTEDYIGTGWGQGQYAMLYQGCHIADTEDFVYNFYRLHIPDPVYFHEEARVTIQQIGWWGRDYHPEGLDTAMVLYKAGDGMERFVFGEDQGLFERQDDWSSCAWFYLDRPVNGLPPIDGAEERMAGL